ncbi:dienelactone hydrolase family protein [Stagonosporopsis vannaccii]|nr:dienelactone hydrolase family protein [Stagonosporopsis vannaccii]
MLPHHDHVTTQDAPVLLAGDDDHHATPSPWQEGISPAHGCTLSAHADAAQSWNVYSPANIARVKADEDAAAAREAAADQRMQELDAERRAAILRGRTPPPLPDDVDTGDGKRKRDRDGGHDRKRRKLKGEDDTDQDIRLAASRTRTGDGDGADAKILKLRKPASDAPLTDHAGHIDLFPVDMKEALKRERNAEAEQEKRKKEQAFEDQYTMRFSNAAGRDGLGKPWYIAQHNAVPVTEGSTPALEYPGFESKDVWGNEDSRRKEREQARISSNDPFAFMQQAQTQLKKSKEDKKRWADERKRELKELRNAQDAEARRGERHSRSSHHRNHDESRNSNRSLSHKHSHREDRLRRRSQEREHDRREHRSRPSSSRHRSRSPSHRRRSTIYLIEALNSDMASYPSEKCCAIGVKHEGTPKGEIKSIGDIRAYVSPAANGSTQNAILLMTDVLGFQFPNVQLIADQFAANGYYTIVPDVFKGNEIPFPMPADFDFPSWKENKMPRTNDVDPIYAATIKYLRGELGVKRLGGVGYCFGGKYVCRWLKPGGLDAGYTAHPSFVEVEELKGIQGPLSIAAAESDWIFPAEKRRESEDILKDMGATYQLSLYSGVEHGFATKGDLENPRGKFCKELAFLQAVLWFDEYVKKENHDIPIPKSGL